MPIPHYSEFFKSAADVLSGGKEGKYQYDSKLSFSGKGSSGVSVGVVAAKKDPANLGLDLTVSGNMLGMASNLALSSSGKLVGSAAVAEVIPGFKVTATTAYPDPVKTAKVTFDYLLPGLTTRTVLSSLTSPVIDAMVSTSIDKYLLGLDAQYDSGKGVLTKHSVGLSFASGAASVGTSLTNLDALRIATAYQMNASAAVAAELTHKLSSGATSFAVGGVRKIESGLYKAKIDSNGVVSALWGTQINKAARLEISSQFETLDTLGKNAKIGAAVDVNYN